jgi:hypothetical protein
MTLVMGPGIVLNGISRQRQDQLRPVVRIAPPSSDTKHTVDKLKRHSVGHVMNYLTTLKMNLAPSHCIASEEGKSKLRSNQIYGFGFLRCNYET